MSVLPTPSRILREGEVGMLVGFSRHIKCRYPPPFKPPKPPCALTKVLFFFHREIRQTLGRLPPQNLFQPTRTQFIPVAFLHLQFRTDLFDLGLFWRLQRTCLVFQASRTPPLLWQQQRLLHVHQDCQRKCHVQQGIDVGVAQSTGACHLDQSHTNFVCKFRTSTGATGWRWQRGGRMHHLFDGVRARWNLGGVALRASISRRMCEGMVGVFRQMPVVQKTFGGYERSSIVHVGPV